MTHHLSKLTLFLCLSIALACTSGGDNSKSDETPIPNLAQWEANMITYGELLAARLQDPNYDPEFKLADTYYDAQWTFFQIGDYTGDSRWYTYAQAAELTYRDSYLIPNDAFLPGYWLFPHGLAEDALRTGDEVSKTALNGIATNGAYARDTTDPSETISAEFSRETAYAIHTYLQTERLGAARRERLTLLVDHALGHFDQWFGTRNADYVRPFMVGISAHALIAYYNQVSSDGRILEALKQAADSMWAQMWLPQAASFQYTDRETSSGGKEPAPDLNLLIAPLYAWLYHETGDRVYLERGDAIFSGGVLGAYLDGGKQFNQNYRWSFDYLRYRRS